jgi:hypothetical protein
MNVCNNVGKNISEYMQKCFSSSSALQYLPLILFTSLFIFVMILASFHGIRA